MDAGVQAALERERRLWDGFRANDVIALESMISPDVTDVGPAGVLQLDGVLRALAAMTITGYTIEAATLRDLGDVHVVIYTSTVCGTYQGRPFPARRVVNTSVWAREGQSWRLVHRHETPLDNR